MDLAMDLELRFLGIGIVPPLTPTPNSIPGAVLPRLTQPRLLDIARRRRHCRRHRHHHRRIPRLRLRSSRAAAQPAPRPARPAATGSTEGTAKVTKGVDRIAGK